MPRVKQNFAILEKDDQRETVSMRLMLGGNFAEIVPDQDRSVFHWVVQLEGSAEVLQMGQELSFARALDRAHYALEILAGLDLKKAQTWYEFGEQRI